MSAKCTFWAWEQEGIKGAQVLVLLQLADNSNDDGLSWYSIEKMASRCKIGVRTFRDNLKILEEKGLVTVTRRQNRSSLYQLSLGCEIRRSRGAKSAGGGCEIRRSRGAKSAYDPKRDPNNDPKEKNKQKRNRRNNEISPSEEFREELREQGREVKF
ncbi:helix-turn-helix domain-containing protein [Vibrio mediterranei]|uniref:helix-turn-helix domain-containing protein n=1 Tax=Vibrio mediterranei TaxID=689 RepID=UPI0017CEB063|nr:helix-turn-helix domain-containing protein [Vibrio mediterranei]